MRLEITKKLIFVLRISSQINVKMTLSWISNLTFIRNTLSNYNNPLSLFHYHFSTTNLPLPINRKIAKNVSNQLSPFHTIIQKSDPIEPMLKLIFPVLQSFLLCILTTSPTYASTIAISTQGNNSIGLKK